MDCRDVKNMLSEYIDGVLADDAATRIRGHLESCGDCTEMYESMTRLIGHMKNMESIDEPESLLGDVKAVLEKRFSWTAVWRQLFSPPLVKVPLELAVVAIIVVFMVHFPGIGGGPELYEITFAFDSKEKVLSNDTKVLEPIRLEGAEKDVATPPAEVMDAEKSDKGTMERTESRPSPVSYGKSVPVGKKSKSATNELHVRGGRSTELETKVTVDDKAMRSRAEALEEAPAEALGDAPVKTVVKTQEKALAEAVDETTTDVFTVTSSDTKEKKESSKDEPLLGVIASVEGKVVESVYVEGTRRLKTLTVEIPAQNYQIFIQALDKLGEVGREIPAPADASGTDGVITIRIHLL